MISTGLKKEKVLCILDGWTEIWWLHVHGNEGALKLTIRLRFWVRYLRFKPCTSILWSSVILVYVVTWYRKKWHPELCSKLWDASIVDYVIVYIISTFKFISGIVVQSVSQMLMPETEWSTPFFRKRKTAQLTTSSPITASLMPIEIFCKFYNLYYSRSGPLNC